VLGLAHAKVAGGGRRRDRATRTADVDVAGGRGDARLAFDALHPDVPARRLDAQGAADHVDVDLAGRAVHLDVAHAATGLEIRRGGAQVEIGLRRAVDPKLELGRAELDEPTLLRDVDDDLEAIAAGPAVEPDAWHDLPRGVVQRLELDAGLARRARANENLAARNPE